MMISVSLRIIYVILILIFICDGISSYTYSSDSNIYSKRNRYHEYSNLATLIRKSTNAANLVTRLDANVLPSGRCLNETAIWFASLVDFMNALTLDCRANDTQCEAIQSAMIEENIFAAKQLDSFGRIPAGLLDMNNVWMGSWEECNAVTKPNDQSYATQFCYVHLGSSLITDGLTSSGIVSGEGAGDVCESPLLLQWSVCMPESCSHAEVASFFRQIGNLTGGLLESCDATCFPDGEPKKDAAFWIVSIYCILGAIAILFCGLIDYLTDGEQWKELRNKTWMKCLLTFSLYTNGSQILDQTKRPGQIQCLDCIRAFSMTWVICGHVMANFVNADNVLAVLDSTNTFLNDALTNAFFSVDTFFFLGGVLIAYIFFRQVDKNPRQIRSPVFWVLYYLHRYLRLSPPYFLFIGVSAAIQNHLTRGPMQLAFIFDQEACRKYWWRNVLYINNLYGLESQCMAHTWYLAVDWQIHIFSPLLIVPLFFSEIAGVISSVLLLAASIVANYVTFYKHDFAANFIGMFTSVMDFTKLASYEQLVYYSPWIRFTPYVFGILTGYFLHKTREQKFTLHPLIIIALWLASIATGIACVFGLFDYMKGPDHNISLFARASYYNWSRIGWSLALAWVVIACEKNWAGPVKNFMELGFWMPFGRLTYCAYLIHFLIVDVLLSMKRQPLHYAGHLDGYLNYAISSFVVSYVVAFFWSCAFELSFMKLEKMAIDKLVGGARRQPRQPKLETLSGKLNDCDIKQQDRNASMSNAPIGSESVITTKADMNNSDGINSLANAPNGGVIEPTELKQRKQSV
uniref:Nose resistant-to-fluoxetine protein N-terminal domain-containing protein n=1 Tax=Parascaris univalens TaxID=6257 RepID=A0A915AML5_PARUN